LKNIDETVAFIKGLFPDDSLIPLHEPRFDESDKQALLDCVNTTFVSSVGEFVDRLEREIADFCGVGHAIAVVNGTAALHTALVVSGVGAEHEVITQALTFVATANAICYCGADPIFIDVDLDSMALDPIALEKFLMTSTFQDKNGVCTNKLTGKKIKACIPMHTFGHVSKMDEIIQACHRRNITVIEDAAEALGSSLGARKAGSIGDIGTFSFNGNKIITCGGGGIITTNDPSIAKLAKHLTTTAKVPHKFDYFHDQIGFNYRLPNLNASLACSQLAKIDYFIEQKQKLARKYEAFFAEQGITSFKPREGIKSNYWLNAIILESREDRDHFLKLTNEKGVMTRPIWKLMSELPMFAKCQTDGLEQSRYLADRVVNLPSSAPRL